MECYWQRCFDLMSSLRVTIIIPAYRENETITPTLMRIAESILIPFECVVVIDEPDDKTIDYVKKFSELNPHFRFVANDLGKDPRLL